MPITLTFLGAARTVTGSKYLLDTGEARVLIDAGLFQGLKELRELNWKDLPVPASSLDAIVLTHAHLDHFGYLPRIVMQGFSGRVFCTAGTKDLCRIVLPDSGRIQEEDAANANRHGFSRHKPALPLYGEADAFRAVSLLQPVGYERPMPVAAGVEVDFIAAGHLLGSAYARVRVGGTTILFGGDLGRYDRPVLPDPVTVERADYLLVESTYGDRVHEDDDDGESLAAVIRATAERGGKLIIPAFAIGRVEELLYWIGRLEEQKRIPVLPVFLDSPMALEALARYTERINELDPDLQPEKRDEKAPLRRERARAAAEAPRTGGARAPRVRVLHDAVPRHRVERRIEAAHAVAHAGDRHLVERDGDRRPRAAPLEGRAAEPAQHGAARRFPGGGHARAAAARRRHHGQDSRSAGAGAGAHRSHRVDVGARGFHGNPALARRLHRAAQAHVPGARRAAVDGPRWARRSARSSAGTSTCRTWTKSLHWNDEPAVFDGSRDGTCICGKRCCGGQR